MLVLAAISNFCCQVEIADLIMNKLCIVLYYTMGIYFGKNKNEDHILKRRWNDKGFVEENDKSDRNDIKITFDQLNIYINEFYISTWEKLVIILFNYRSCAESLAKHKLPFQR